MNREINGVCHFHSETGTEGGYWAVQDKKFMGISSENPDGLWSYEGLNILRNGDQLTIFSLQNLKEVVWSGLIDLYGFPPLEGDLEGFWIHALQKGVDREVWASWFMNHFPARLLIAEKSQTRVVNEVENWEGMAFRHLGNNLWELSLDDAQRLYPDLFDRKNQDQN